MNFYAIEIISGVAQLLILGLWIWLAILLFRQRTKGAWIVLTGTILTVVYTILIYFGRPLLGSVFGFDSQHYYFTINMLGNVSRLLIVGGLLMHLLQQRSESERIAELEAIIRDRDGTP